MEVLIHCQKHKVFNKSVSLGNINGKKGNSKIGKWWQRINKGKLTVNADYFKVVKQGNNKMAQWRQRIKVDKFKFANQKHA